MRVQREPWPGNEGHSSGGRPFIYKGRESGKWWVDASGFREQQRGFKTWEAAVAFALRVPFNPDRQNARRLGLIDR
jgi:hypothetical protein